MRVTPARRGRLIGLAAIAGPVAAQSPSGDAATIAELRPQLDEMRRRLEQLEARTAAAAPAPVAVPAARPSRQPRTPPAAGHAGCRARAAAAEPARPRPRRARRSAPWRRPRPTCRSRRQPRRPGAARTHGHPDRRRGCAALRLAGIASGCRNGYEVRLYGFAKLTGSYISAPQPDGRAAPAEHPADRKRRRRASGDFFMTGRFSRFGTTRGPDGLGHAGNAPRRRFGGARRPPPRALPAAPPGLAELGDDSFRVSSGRPTACGTRACSRR